MKKLFALVLVLILALGCTAALAEQYTIYLVTMDLEDMHWVSVNAGAEDAVAEAKEAGVDIRYVWVGPTVGKNDAAQIECINNAYADNANVILLASNGPETEVETIERYDADGVKFVYVDSPANSDVALCTLATDNTEAGRMTGRTLLEALEAEGITEGKIGIVNINTSTVSTQYRENGFREVFEGKGYELLETQYGEGDAAKSQEIATNFITQGVVGLFGCNEGATVGTGNAIAAETDSKVLGVGFDKSDAILNLVMDGKLIATTAQNPYNMGYEGIKVAVEYLTNGTTEFEDVDTGVTMLTADVIEAEGLLN